jgi:hypothetical protein
MLYYFINENAVTFHALPLQLCTGFGGTFLQLFYLVLIHYIYIFTCCEFTQEVYRFFMLTCTEKKDLLS